GCARRRSFRRRARCPRSPGRGWSRAPRRGSGAARTSRPALLLGAPEDVARGELQLLLGGDGRGGVALSGQIVLHVVCRKEERRVHVVVGAGAVNDQDRVRVGALGQIVAQLVGVLPGDVGDAEAAVL